MCSIIYYYMDIQIEKVFTESGFSRGEAKTYIALLDLKEATQVKFQKNLKFIRVIFIDILKET